MEQASKFVEKTVSEKTKLGYKQLDEKLQVGDETCNSKTVKRKMVTSEDSHQDEDAQTVLANVQENSVQAVSLRKKLRLELSRVEEKKSLLEKLKNQFVIASKESMMSVNIGGTILNVR